MFVTYDGKRASDIAVSRYAVRHLVAGEVWILRLVSGFDLQLMMHTQIDAYLITRQADAVEKGKPGKLDYFSKMSAYVPVFFCFSHLPSSITSSHHDHISV